MKSNKNLDSICILRINNLKQLKLSKPCFHCCLLLKKSHIKNIYYSDEDGKIKFIKVKELKAEHCQISRGHK